MAKEHCCRGYNKQTVFSKYNRSFREKEVQESNDLIDDA